MIARLKEVNAGFAPINQPVLLSDPPRPAAPQHVFERLGLADARERIAEDRFYKLQNAQGRFPVGPRRE